MDREIKSFDVEIKAYSVDESPVQSLAKSAYSAKMPPAGIELTTTG